MYRLIEKRFADFFRDKPETGMGYWVTTVYLKDGRVFKQAIVDSGYLAKIRGLSEIPFSESDIDYFEITHDKWQGAL